MNNLYPYSLQNLVILVREEGNKYLG